MERSVWAEASQIDRQAAAYLKGGQVADLHRLALSVPLADGVRLARRLGKRAPDIFTRMAGFDRRLLARVVATAARESCREYKDVTAPADWVSFGVGDPVLTLTSYDSASLTKISMLRDSAWHEIYHGDRHHGAVACIDAENVVAVRSHPEHGYELVHYADGQARPVMQGRVVLGTTPLATAAGFVAGSGLSPGVVVAGPGRPAEIMDLASYGLSVANRLAADPAGQIVAFGAETIVVTDARLERLVARAAEPLPHRLVFGLTFTTPRDLIATGDGGGLSRWRLTPHNTLTLEAAAGTPRLNDLVSIPAWGVVGGHDGSAGRHYFYDPVTLEPVSSPRQFTEAQYDPRFVRAISASVDGRFAVVGGQLNAGKRRGSVDFILAVHDFHHPLARLLRPVAALDEHDLAAIAQAAPGRTPEERQVLDLLHAVTEHCLRT